ncbi:MAG: HAD-IIIA family hydrolase [Candidatus Marinimicrobia bacterium]|nr:HAD-IIIA family hydrolase [Candidatus Neomarinimicrobiota bacterium]
MSIKEKAKKIKLIGTDIDGVWTDGTMYYSPEGDFMKAFSTYDGMAVQIAKEHGFDILIMTGENSEMVKRRAEKLKIEKVYLGEKEKLKRLKYICSRFEYSLDEIAYIGDDINDLEVLNEVGLSGMPSSSPILNEFSPDIITKKGGGEGAFREFVNYIIKFK